ncbi:hypothetical protein QYM36_010894 [Artemia franciscana]|uniref:Uncharacterized protein n=1 Tax=Artemia franciscana TaxID=6661 RepID=A0AA88HHC0_ARTSF|nr:hypothetical protein QYM36_010894 [Artemia franciscana]
MYILRNAWLWRSAFPQVTWQSIDLNSKWFDFKIKSLDHLITGKCDKTLEPNEYFDATTFVTHPWIFRDSATREKLVAIAPAITCQEVFFAKPWWEHRGQSDPENRGRIERVPVFIRYPLLTLRKASLLAVRRSLANPKDACRLDLPKILQKDIAEWSDDVR